VFRPVIHEPDGAVVVRNPSVLPTAFAQYSIVCGAEAVFSGTELPPELQAAVAIRRTQFLAGRYCAAQAITRLCGTAASVTVGRGSDGSPVWPNGLTGSITHSGDFASAAVASRKNVRSLGIDTEHIMATVRARRIASAVLVASEVSAASRAIDEAVWITLVFSAKEALFKCLYPLVGRSFDYSAVAVTSIDTTTGRLGAELQETLTSELQMGRSIEGRFEIGERYVHTGIWLTVEL
jgi:enterobactin synthetase component D